MTEQPLAFKFKGLLIRNTLSRCASAHLPLGTSDKVKVLHKCSLCSLRCTDVSPVAYFEVWGYIVFWEIKIREKRRII
jgi:hypothetical protein